MPVTQTAAGGTGAEAAGRAERAGRTDGTAGRTDGSAGRTEGHPRVPATGRRALQLALGGLWLLDGLLQLQPLMFAGGGRGLGPMLAGGAVGNPWPVAHSIAWNASVIDHHAAATDTAFALIQIALGLGIAWRPSIRAALAASIGWSMLVWWFGEGLGGVLRGDGTPIGGGPGAVLFYALLAVLLWPTDRVGPSPPFVAARAVGTAAARATWVVVWTGMALLALVGSGRSPHGIGRLIGGLRPGQPGWLAGIDRRAGTLVGHQGLATALIFAAVCTVVASAVLLPRSGARVVLVLGALLALVVWVVGENFGMILAGGATDPNSGPLLVLLVLAYWPVGTAGPPTPPATVGDGHLLSARAH